MKIIVNNKDYGFFTSKPITVYRLDDSGMVWCNHDGAETTDVADGEGTRQELVCDKCYAVFEPVHEEWHNAPFLGETFGFGAYDV